MKKLVLYIIGTFASFVGAISAMQMADPSRLQGKFEYDVWAPIYGLLIVAILFAILLILHACRKSTPTKRRRVQIMNIMSATSGIASEPSSDELPLD
jgi:hypothetical protein